MVWDASCSGEGQAWKPPHGKGTFVPFLWSFIAATSALELDPFWDLLEGIQKGVLPTRGMSGTMGSGIHWLCLVPLHPTLQWPVCGALQVAHESMAAALVAV